MNEMRTSRPFKALVQRDCAICIHGISFHQVVVSNVDAQTWKPVGSPVVQWAHLNCAQKSDMQIGALG